MFTFHSEKKVVTGNVTGVLDIETKQGWRHMIKVIGEGNGSEQGSQLTQLAAFL